MAVPSVGNYNTVTGNGGSVTLNNPTGYADGSIFIVFIYSESSTDWTAPSGWTLQDSAELTGGEPQYIDAWTYVWNTSDPTSHEFTWGDFAAREAIIIDISGADESDHFEVSSNNTGTGTTLTIAAVSPSTTDYLTVAIGSNWQWASLSTPTNYTLINSETATETWYSTTQSGAAATSTIGASSGWAAIRIVINSVQTGGDAITPLARRIKASRSPLVRM